MKHRTVFAITMASFLIFSLSASGKDKPKVTKAAATKAAKAAAPKGKILNSELEYEKGNQVWSFDIRDGKDLREVWVDATTGQVTHNEIETKADQAAEKKMDKAEAIVKRKYKGVIINSQAEGENGATDVYAFDVRKKDGTIQTVRVNAKSYKIVK